MTGDSTLSQVYDEIVRALDVRALVRARVRGEPRVVIGLGKIAAEMCPVELLDRAVLAVPRDAPEVAARQLWRGAHPIPDETSLAAGQALLDAAATADGEVLVLISGGGSAIAEVPRIPLALLREVNERLLRSGAAIEEINCVRAHLSRFKGGGLARALHAAGVRSARALVAIDVPRGGPAAVSSGPAAADATTIDDARRLAARFLPGLEELPFEETLKPGEPADFVPREALTDLRSPALEAARRGFTPLGLAEGSVEEFAARLAALPKGKYAASGELTLQVPRDAPAGGRDQHLALLVAKLLRGKRFTFLAAGTDGRDGPTRYAGAIVDGETWDRAEDPEGALREFDAARALAPLGALLDARHTGAHAGDLFLFDFCA